MPQNISLPLRLFAKTRSSTICTARRRYSQCTWWVGTVTRKTIPFKHETAYAKWARKAKGQKTMVTYQPVYWVIWYRVDGVEQIWSEIPIRPTWYLGRYIKARTNRDQSWVIFWLDQGNCHTSAEVTKCRVIQVLFLRLRFQLPF